MTRIIFFGTSEFALPALRKLAADSNYEIETVITQPDMPAHRTKELTAPPVKIEGQKLGLKVLQLEKLEVGSWKTIVPEADLYVVASFGQIIPKAILDIPKNGAVNIHPSLLPKYRGPAPIQAAILGGDPETGVAIMRLDEEVDHGPILASAVLQNMEPRIHYELLHDKLAALGADLLTQVLPKYLAGELKPVEQDHSQATFTKILTKEDGRIKWSKTAEEVERLVRAYSQWPVAWSTFDGKRIKIYDGNARSGMRGAPGMIMVDDFRMNVCCGKDTLAIYELQLEGGKQMTAAEFLRGHPGLDAKFLV